MGSFPEMFKKLNDECLAAQKSSNAESVWKLSATLQSIKEGLQNHIQSLTKEQASTILKKLRNNQALSDQESSLLKYWVCGDATYVGKFQDHFASWQNEVKSLMDQINALNKGKELDVEESIQLKALMLDAIRILKDQAYYLEQQERVENFSQTSKQFTKEEIGIIIRMLEKKLASENK